MLKCGLILNKEFHLNKNWMCGLSYYFVNSLLKEFECTFIESQNEYNDCVNDVDFILHISPGWSSKAIKHNRDKKTLVIMSDFHSDKWRQDYFIDNNIDYLLAYYPSPAKYHFSKIDVKKIIPFYWSVDERFINTTPKYLEENVINIFGAKNHEAYETREWCKQFDFVDSYNNSGVENKLLSYTKYNYFLTIHDNFIAAGSLDERYKMLLPKYFEIMAGGALLFAQYNDDLQEAGFVDWHNCIIFNKNNFEAKARLYLKEKEYLQHIRKNGIELMKTRHTNKHRIELIKELIND